MDERIASINRETNETKINIEMNLDNREKGSINTGIGFFNHMLDLFAFHSGINLNIIANGDLDVCDHHTVEDVGIVIGKCIKEALGNMKGIKRYGTFYIPMDETLAMVSLDISGRPFLQFNGEFKRESIGDFSVEMTKEFFRAVAFNAGITLHINIMYGENDHHKIEAIFKAFGRALKEAITIVGDEMPSTKGVL